MIRKLLRQLGWALCLAWLSAVPAWAQADLDQLHYRWRNDNGTEASATWYDPRWAKRRSITVDNSSNASTLTDYQILVNVTYDADMQTDFDDIRFANASGTELDFWLEQKTDSTSADFWVEVDSVAASTTTTIYMYYSNPVATSSSSLADTFRNDEVYLEVRRCPSGDTDCNGTDNHTEFENVITDNNTLDGSGYIDNVDQTSNPYGTQDNFFMRMRFLFQADTTGSHNFLSNSDDGSEVNQRGATDTTSATVPAFWYGNHAANGSTCGTGGTAGSISLTAGDVIWLEYRMTEVGGSQVARLCVQEPSGSYTTVNATNFPGQLYAREITSPEPGITVNAESDITAGATFAASEDTGLTNLPVLARRRLRFLVSNEGASTSGAVTYRLEVAETATCSSGSYTRVGSDPDWEMTASTYITDGDPTGNIPGLTDENTTFVSGELNEGTDTAGALTLTTSEFTELEFVIRPTVSATPGGDYCFRLTDAGSATGFTYSVYAQAQLEAGFGTVSGTTDLGDGITVRMAVNGSLIAQTGTTSRGTWSITPVSGPSIGDVVTVWADGVADGSETTGVTIYDGFGDITNMVLNQNVLSVGSDDNQSVTLSDFGLYDNDDDEDIMHTYNGSTLTVDADDVYGADELIILSGETLTLGSSETIDAHHVTIDGALTSSGSGSINLTGDWDNNSEFVSASETVNFLGVSGTISIDSTGATDAGFYNITFNDGGGTAVFEMDSDLDVDHDVSIVNGTLNTNGTFNYDITIAGDWDNGDGFQANSSDLTLDGSSGQTFSAGTSTYNAIIVTNASASGVTFDEAVTVTNFTNIVPGSRMTFQASTTFTITGALTINGAAGNLIVLNSSDGSNRFTFDVTGGPQTVNRIDLSNANASSNDITANSSLDRSNNDDGEASPHWIFAGCTIAGAPNGTWYDSRWNYRKPIFIDCTEVSGSSDLTDFPVLISTTDNNLQDTSNGGHVGQSDGDDILFTEEDGTTKLNHEIEAYDNTTGELVAWVQVGTLSATAETVLYMYYGNASAANQQNVTATWDSDYLLVAHLNETTTGATDFMDSTGNNHDSTAVTFGGGGSDAGATGQIAGGVQFDGTDDVINFGNDTHQIEGAGSRTICAWALAESFDNGGIFQAGPAGTTGAGFSLRTLTTSEAWRAQFWGGPDFDTTLSGSANNWRYYCLAYDGSTITLYYDGAFDSSAVESLNTGDDDVRIGVWRTDFFDGYMDEFRISDVERSSDWIQTEFNTMSDPSSFFFCGDEESRGPLRGAVILVD